MRDLAEMRIPYHTAQRAIKFYLRGLPFPSFHNLPNGLMHIV